MKEKRMDTMGKYLHYLDHNQGAVQKAHFIEDWEPVGTIVMNHLIKQGLALDSVDLIELSDSGRAAIRQPMVCKK